MSRGDFVASKRSVFKKQIFKDFLTKVKLSCQSNTVATEMLDTYFKISPGVYKVLHDQIPQ